uniref:PKD protein n=1 Tax=uncultured bacterium Contigcl_1539 TaxID=1393650 RepID=W0FR21_9BACT|nr:PKD protein [uncultured bacterium Contigcl_1539]
MIPAFLLRIQPSPVGAFLPDIAVHDTMRRRNMEKEKRLHPAKCSGEKTMQEILINRVYKHFKGDYYLVVDFARHSETDETYVVYRRLYGDGSLWIRPYDMFASEVDHEKYPDVKQKYRFELQEIESVAK